MIKIFQTFLLASTLQLLNAKDKIYVDSKNRLLRDPQDRHLIMHGVNVVYKIPPYIPDQETFDSQSSLTDRDIQDLSDWGFNLVRLGVMWESVESAPGVYNHTYLDEIDKLISKLGEKGIYTLVDAHQDVLARSVCGEGMPNFYANQVIQNGTYCFGKWADYFLAPIAKLLGACKSINDYGYRRDSDGNPLIQDCQQNSFFIYYTSPESFTLFRSFYTNNLGIQDKFVDFWEQVSNRLSQNKYVIGFDPFNEPFPSWNNILGAIYELMPGNMDSSELAPLYERIFQKYKNADERNIMFFEPSQFPDILSFGIGKFQILELVNRLGFKNPPGGKIGSDKHVLNDHTYCCQLSPDICSKTGEPTADTAQRCEEFHQKRVGTRDLDAQKLGIPLIISEFGACMDSDDCAREINQVADVCESYLTSWAYWQFKNYKDLTTSAGDRSEGFYNNDGSLQVQKVKALTRTYVKAAQGKIISVNFSPQNAEFRAVIQIDTSINAPTEIFAFSQGRGDVWYKNGVDLQVQNHDTCPEPVFNSTIENNSVKFIVTNPEFNYCQIQVRIMPKNL